MAQGIVKLHTKGCPAKDGGRCRCKAGYEAWVYLARERRKVRKTFKREAEAKTWRVDALAAANKGNLRPAKRDGRTLAAALREFVEGMKDGTVRPKGRERYKPNTVRSYERALRVHIEPSAVARVKVGEVHRRDLQALADDLLASGFAIGTVSNVLNPIQAFYRRAIDRSELNFNPSEGIDLPAGSSKRPKRIASAEEALALLRALEPEDRPVWATAFYAGLRRGELQALRVCDVDLGASLIRVEHGWDQEEGEIDPKSESGRRTVPLLAALRDYLDEHLLRTARTGDELVFGRSAGAAFVASTVDNRAKRAWKAANEEAEKAAEGAEQEPRLLAPITLHECRHTFASLLIDSGANAKAIQEFMGHSKIQTTFDIYGHLLPGSHDDVRARMDAYLAAGEAASEAEDVLTGEPTGERASAGGSI
jgi:integrase